MTLPSADQSALCINGVVTILSIACIDHSGATQISFGVSLSFLNLISGQGKRKLQNHGSVGWKMSKRACFIQEKSALFFQLTVGMFEGNHDVASCANVPLTLAS
jgi:hypothetical protein